MGLKQYIIESSSKKREYSLFNSIPLFIKDPPRSAEVDIPELVSSIEELLPPNYFVGVEAVYIGRFPELEKEGKKAAFADGALYVSNDEETTFDLLEDVIHETAHAVEKEQFTFIYSDGLLEKEFLGKRQRLQSILEGEGFNLPEKYYLDTEYNENFDRYLSDLIGYPLLLNLTMGLFVSPYGATSLREYFANAFENYYLDNAESVKDISPAAYQKIVTLHNEETQ